MARRSAELRCHTSSSAPGGSSRPSSMPLRPAESNTEKARYGFAAESIARYSTRVDWPLPGLWIGMRTNADLLFEPQHTYDGASAPPHRRLYEFTYWLVMALISGAYLSSPAMKWRAV